MKAEKSRRISKEMVKARSDIFLFINHLLRIRNKLLRLCRITKTGFLSSIYARRRKAETAFQPDLLKLQLDAEERASHSLSEEIHDNIGQALTLMNLNINAIDINQPDTIEQKLSECKNLLKGVIQDLRDVSKTLNPYYISNIGLPRAVEHQLLTLKKTGLYLTELDIMGEVFTFEPYREQVIFRIIKELLNNIMKHSEASAITIVMKYSDEKLVLTIKDNGKGFSSNIFQLSSATGLGLFNIQHRVKLINCNVHFKSQPQIGTTISIELFKILKGSSAVAERIISHSSL